MAEYYPLLAKAIAGLPNSTPEMRRVIYDRARKALLGQLRGLDPPIAEADIERETRALDEASARLEEEFGAASPAAPIPDSAAAAPRLKPFVPPSRAGGDGPAPAVRPWAPPGTRVAVPTAAEPEAPQAVAFPAPGSAPAYEAPDSFADDPASVRPATQRPFAPQPPQQAQGHRNLWIVAGVVGLVVVGVAIAAWKLRDHPEEMARLKTPQPATDAAGSKIIDRIGGGPAASSTAAAPQAGAAPASTQTQPATSAAPATTDAANPPAPVAYRAALLVEAPDEPNKVKTYVGTAIWHLDTVSGPNQPVSTAVRADIDVPEAKLQARLVLQKNFDASLPASHTMKITFTIDRTGPLDGAKQISVPQMRKEGSPTGEALAGVPVPIMENSFLVGLSPGTFEAGNITSLQDNQWIDIPILLNNGHIAKLTFEKGIAGQRAIDDAVASWKGQQQQ